MADTRGTESPQNFTRPTQGAQTAHTTDINNITKSTASLPFLRHKIMYSSDIPPPFP